MAKKYCVPMINDLITKHKKALKVSTFGQNVLSSFIVSMQYYLPMQKVNSVDNQIVTDLWVK